MITESPRLDIHIFQDRTFTYQALNGKRKSNEKYRLATIRLAVKVLTSSIE